MTRPAATSAHPRARAHPRTTAHPATTEHPRTTPQHHPEERR